MCHRVSHEIFYNHHVINFKVCLNIVKHSTSDRQSVTKLGGYSRYFTLCMAKKSNEHPDMLLTKQNLPEGNIQK